MPCTDPATSTPPLSSASPCSTAPSSTSLSSTSLSSTSLSSTSLSSTALAARFAQVRARSCALAAPLSAEDACVQSMPDASPAKWHLAHTSWFFETFVLEACEAHFRPFQDAFRVLFNSYYNSVGARHPRPQRGLLTRPTLATVLDYRASVDARIDAVLAADALTPAQRQLLELGLHHEQQHQELLLTDIKHLFSCNPLRPAYREPSRAPAPARPAGAPALHWHGFAGGVHAIGHDGAHFHFDNEGPRHRVHLEDFELASRLVSAGEFLAFIEDGGYREPRLWLSDGWDWREANARTHPWYWEPGPEGWQIFTLGGLRALDPAEPVVHVSLYEADAYARWANARLPSEAEWEVAALASGADAAAAQCNFVDRGALHPCPASAPGLAQMFGDAWEWTQSAYAAYPGFRASAGAVGEYNGKFMINQYVLRGGSCASPAEHLRATYRNFFPAPACWQFSGIRLAR